MDLQLLQRIEAVQKLRQEFGLDQQKIADNAEPKKSRETVVRVLKGVDEKYITESNVLAIEKGIEKLLNEYRSKLCGK